VVGVPPILVIIALLIGLNLAGFMGVILSVPLAAALMEFVNDIEKKKLEENPQ
jgi:predicted PurR-regulated permease PerM